MVLLPFITLPEVGGHFNFQLNLGLPPLVPPDTQPGVLIDVTKSEELRSYETMQKLAQLFGEHAASLSGRIAVVVSTQARFGTARQFGMLVQEYGVEARAFPDRPAAVSWLAEVE